MPSLWWVSTLTSMTRYKWGSEASTITSRPVLGVWLAPWTSSRIMSTGRRSWWRRMRDSSSLRDLRGIARRDFRERSPCMKSKDAERRKRSKGKEIWRQSVRNTSTSRRSSWLQLLARNKRRCRWSRRKSSSRRPRKEKCARRES